VPTYTSLVLATGSDLSAWTLTSTTATVFSEELVSPLVISDLLIDLTVGKVERVGVFLAQGGPCLARWDRVRL
jgi:hypothetical protein